ncbi:MAG: NUDIX domain-containing protein [Candidatus Micrarchaeia archaeon]
MTPERIEGLPYRNNVCGIVFNGKKFLLLQRPGWPSHWWKFPQGGVEAGETDQTAVQRELREELGTDAFRIIGESLHANRYDWSQDSVEKSGYKWRGQIQKFFLIEYLGDPNELEADGSEVQRYKWVELNDLFASIDHDHPNFANYKNTIEKVLKEFKRI